jgi:hypothetical protein
VAVDDVYVLGAGASYVHGAPLTDQILPYALSQPAIRRDRRMRRVHEFLQQVFHFVPPRTPGAPGWERMPSLVDVLSVLDVAIDRKESLARGYDVERLRRVRTALEFAIFSALEDSLSRRRGKATRRSRATQRLAERLDPDKAAVISFNYDVIADIALAMRGRAFGFDRADLEVLGAGDHQAVDYGVDFANVTPASGDKRRFQLYKLHGSFNWLRSRLTGNLYFGGMRKAAGILFQNDTQRAASDLSAVFEHKTSAGHIPETFDDLEPVLITPTHLKDLRNPHLARIWRRAEECLRAAKRITFIGYSLPSDDLHVKYLFKRAMETRAPNLPPPSIVVVDKGNPRTSQVRRNYERYFGKQSVKYCGEGFDAWAARL